jgi:hypothetical protein
MRLRLLTLILGGFLALAGVPSALADGTETLGAPSIPVATGTNVVAAGVGMHGFPNTPNSFNVTVPAGASVKQVLLYWQGHATGFNADPCLGAPGLDNAISVNGNAVAGTLIGGATNFFLAEYFATYRVDITNLNLVSAGLNTLTISNMRFISCFDGYAGIDGNDGAGVLVIYDTGADSAVVGVRDGQDLAYALFAPPLNTTVAQTFTFSASPTSRPATLATLAGSVSGPDLSGLRGTKLAITFNAGGAGDTVLINPWQSDQGEEFDALNSAITVPASATAMTVQALSEGGVAPASLAWIAASLSIANPPTPGGGEGCTPGYWKRHLSSWGPTGYSPSQLLSTVFSPTGLGTLGSKTLFEALNFGGGSTLTEKKQILLRIAVASLLNSAHPDVDFAQTTAQVISSVNAALESNNATTIETLKNQLDALNNSGCPLN